MADKFDDVLLVLVNSDGACLYWQMPDAARAKAALAAGLIKEDEDLLVHPEAIVIEAGMAYTMPEANCRHRNDGRGFCIDCGNAIGD